MVLVGQMRHRINLPSPSLQYCVRKPSYLNYLYAHPKSSIQAFRQKLELRTGAMKSDVVANRIFE